MMIRQRLSRKIRENALAVFFALVLSFGVYIVGHNTGMLTADVVGGPQAEFNAYSDIVVAPKGEDGLSIFAGKNMENIETISMILLFDPERMTLATDSFSSSTMNFSYSDAGVGKGTLVLTNTKNINFSVRDILVNILAPGSFQDLVVGDVIVVFTDGATESLSVELPK